MKNSIAVLLLLSLVFSCKDSQKAPSYAKKDASSIVHKGKRLMEASCYSCHSLTAPENSRLAPPMIAIKRRYISKNTSKQDFINDMQSWMKNPTDEKAKMYGAVKRFGLMPKLGYPDETIQLIAEYMFDNELEKPEWFEKHYKEQHGNGMANGIKNGKGKQGNRTKSDVEILPYKERGLKYALSTKAVLGKNLMGKIQKEGTLGALKFCNIKAYPLTDSMAIVNNATIKRVSDKPRNPKNLASATEKGYINIFKEDVKLNKESDPILVVSDTKVHFYYPIKTNRMCLQCHGAKKSEIKLRTIKELEKLYPKDLATGYQENEVRGIWSITFNK